MLFLQRSLQHCMGRMQKKGLFGDKALVRKINEGKRRGDFFFPLQHNRKNSMDIKKTIIYVIHIKRKSDIHKAVQNQSIRQF